VRENILNIQMSGYIDADELIHLFDQLNNFSFDIQEVYRYLGYLSLAKDGFGTHFFTNPADDIIENLITETKKMIKLHHF
jgi:hypothetical protein